MSYLYIFRKSFIPHTPNTSYSLALRNKIVQNVCINVDYSWTFVSPEEGGALGAPIAYWNVSTTYPWSVSLPFSIVKNTSFMSLILLLGVI